MNTRITILLVQVNLTMINQQVITWLTQSQLIKNRESHLLIFNDSLKECPLYGEVLPLFLPQETISLQRVHTDWRHTVESALIGWRLRLLTVEHVHWLCLLNSVCSCLHRHKKRKISCLVSALFKISYVYTQQHNTDNSQICSTGFWKLAVNNLKMNTPKDKSPYKKKKKKLSLQQGTTHKLYRYIQSPRVCCPIRSNAHVLNAWLRKRSSFTANIYMCL